MSRITAYKVIQADGNRALAEDVQRFIPEGWEPHGSVILVGTKQTVEAVTRIYAQAIVKREPEHEELERLRQMERLVGQLESECDTLRLGIPESQHAGYMQELLAKALRGGPYERKG